jgi:hypothetical protein
MERFSENSEGALRLRERRAEGRAGKSQEKDNEYRRGKQSREEEREKKETCGQRNQLQSDRHSHCHHRNLPHCVIFAQNFYH